MNKKYKDLKMKAYVGKKRVNATLMNREDYNEFRGWKLPADEDGADAGYLIEDIDGSKNTDSFDGYVQWVTLEEFARIYQQNNGLSFGDAIDEMKLGKKVCRKGWNGKGMFLYIHVPIYKGSDEHTDCTLPYIVMYTADLNLVPWLASQTDMLSEDWMIVTN